MGKVSFGELVNSSAGAARLHGLGLIGPAKEISFAEIVCGDGCDSVQESEFFKHFCEKKMLHITQDDRTRFEHLLSWQALNDLLTLNLLDEKALRVARDGRDIPPSLYKSKEGERDAVDSRKLHELLSQNASIGINAIHYLSPAVRRLGVQMENALGQRVNTNAYLTFGPGGAFAIHYDSHDVFVLQVHGSKHWFLYDKPEAAPIDYTKRAKPEPREVVFETVLQAGDVLYVPRGTYHRAAVTDTDSVHLTFGIHTFKGLKVIDRVKTAAEKEALFREDILPVRGPEAMAEQEKVVKGRLCEIINEMSFEELVDGWIRGWRPFDQFHLGPRELDDHTILASLLRHRETWRDSVKKKGKEPSEAGQRIIDALIDKNSATVGELKAEFDGVLDEDTLKSTLAELLDDCWIEVVR